MSFIRLKSILRRNKTTNHPQIILEECKYTIKNLKEINILVMALKRAHLMNQIISLE